MARNKTLVRFMAIAVAATTLSTSAPAYAAFDADYYAKQNPDVVAAFGSSSKALENHYNLFGKKEGRAGSSEDLKNSPLRQLFDASFYAKQNPDVVAAFGNNEDALFQHFLIFGIKEGRQINQYFDVKAYKAAYPDLSEKFGDNMELYYKHFVAYGQKEHRTLGGFPSENILPSGKTAVATASAAKSSGSSSSSSSGGSSSNTKPASNKPGLKDATIAVDEELDLTAGNLILPDDVNVATWATSNESIVEVAGGTIKGIAAGTAKITATLDDDEEKPTEYTCTITVTAASIKLDKSSLDVAVGKSETLTPTAYPDNPAVTWFTSNSSVATVSNGTVTGVKAGTADITARITVGNTDYTAVCKVTVTSPSVKLNKTTITLEVGEDETLKPTVLPSGTEVLFDSENTNVATVDENGKVEAKAVGTATITAKMLLDGVTYKAECKVTVKAITPEIKLNKNSATITLPDDSTVTLTATTKPTGEEVIWKSSKEAVATVDENGEVTGVAAGTTTITAKIHVNGKDYTATCTVTVKEAEPEPDPDPNPNPNPDPDPDHEP